MFLVEFLKENNIKPKVMIGERALLDRWRYERYLKEGAIKLIKEIDIRRAPILEGDERNKIMKAENNLKILYFLSRTLLRR
jgi:hypothetical protein